MLTAAWVWLAFLAFMHGLGGFLAIADPKESVEHTLLKWIEAAFCGFCAYAVWQVA